MVEIVFESCGILLSTAMFIYALFGKFALEQGEIAYAISCIISFSLIETSIKMLLSTIRKQKLERELNEIKKLR